MTLPLGAEGNPGQVSTREGEEKRTHIPINVMTLPLLPIVPNVVFISGPVTGGVKMCYTIDPWPRGDVGCTIWFWTGARCTVEEVRAAGDRVLSAVG